MYTCAIVGYMYIHELNYQHTHRSFEHGFVLTRTLFFSKSNIPYRKYTIPDKSYQVYNSLPECLYSVLASKFTGRSEVVLYPLFSQISTKTDIVYPFYTNYEYSFAC